MNHRRNVTRTPGVGPRFVGAAALTLAVPLTAGAVSSVETHPILSASPILAAAEGIVMGATFMPVLPFRQVEKIVQVLNDRYDAGLTFDRSGDGGNVNNLRTPENFSDHTYIDGEQNLLAALPQYHGDDLTVFGVSQSAGIIGMAIRDLQTMDPSTLPADIQFAALAPPTMPQHGNAIGLFLHPQWQELMSKLYPNATQPFPTDGPYDTDVYCGMYDRICDYPLDTSNRFILHNLAAAGHAIHVGYLRLTPDEMQHEMNNAIPLTDISQDNTHFYLMPDIHNFGTAANPDYEPLLPMLNWLTWSKPLYDLLRPYDTVHVNLGYSDAFHTVTVDPFTLNGVDYAGFADQIVTHANVHELAHEAWLAGVAAFYADMGW